MGRRDSDKQTAKAILLVRNLAQRLWAADGDDSDEAMLFIGKHGGLALSRSEAAAFSECLQSLVAIYGSQPSIRTRSKAAVKRLLQDVLLRVLRPGQEEKSRERFERRLSIELRCPSGRRA